MKDFMISMMIMMMPAMKPMVWLGALLAGAGTLLVLARFVFNSNSGGTVLLAGRILLGLAGFFIACEIAGYLLGMPPQINFGDFDKMEFILVPFWQIGVAFLIAALVFGFIGGRTREAAPGASADADRPV